MGSQKRERQKQARQQKLVQQKTTTKQGQRGRQLRNIGLIVGAILVAALVISIFSGGGGDDEVLTEDPTAETPDEGADDADDEGDGDGTPTTIEVALPGAGATISGETPCPPEDGSAERTTGFDGPPPTCIDPEATYRAVLATTEGDITIELDAGAAPVTVNNFVVLARYGFYDGVPFHRIIPGFVNQAGDPVGPTPGTGGPGYTIPDELPTDDDPYPEGAVAMANTGAPDSGGSQFFIVIADGGDRLTPTFTAFGQVIDGLDVAREINQHGDAATNGTPTKEITITSVSIEEA